MKQIILFSRVSTEIQTLEQQTEELRKEAIRMGYDNDHMIVIEYKESGVCLDTEERKGIQDLKDAIANNNDIDGIIIYEISRLSRRPKTLYEVRDWLIERRINLYCIKPQFKLLQDDGTMDMAAQMIFSIFGTMAEEEARMIKTRMLRGKLHTRSKGYYIGGGLLMGYKKDDDGKIVIDEDKAKLVEQIFNEYANGRSITELVRDLVDSGKVGGTYESAQAVVYKLLGRSEYIGQKATTYDYPAIINTALWEKVQERRKQFWHRKLSTKYDCYCTGKLRDANGRLFSPIYANNTYKVYDRNAGKGICANISAVDAIVLYAIKQHAIQTKDTYAGNLRYDLIQRRHMIIDMFKNSKTRMKDIDSRIEKINIRIVNDKISEALGDKLIDEAKKEKETIRRQMVKWDREMLVIGHQISNIYKTAKIDFAKMTNKEIITYIRTYVDHILLTSGRADKNNKVRQRYIEVIMGDGNKYKFDMVTVGKHFEIYDDQHNLLDIDIVKRCSKNLRRKKVFLTE